MASLLLCLFLCILSGCKDSSLDGQDDLALGNEAFAEYDIGDAEMYYERFLRKNQTSDQRWWVWNRLIDIALNIRQEKVTAVDYLEIMLEEFADDEDRRRSIEVSLASLCKDLRMYDRAIALWESLATNPRTPPESRAEAFRDLSQAYLRQLEFTNTTTALEACLQLEVSDSTKADCLYDLAEAQILFGELPQAEENLRALLRSPAASEVNEVLGKFMLADVLDQQGRLKEALDLFVNLKDIHPNAKVVEMRIQSLEGRMKKKR